MPAIELYVDTTSAVAVTREIVYGCLEAHDWSHDTARSAVACQRGKLANNRRLAQLKSKVH